MTCSNGRTNLSLAQDPWIYRRALPLCMSTSLFGIVDSSKKRLQCTGCMLQHTKWLLEHLQWLFKRKLCGPFRYSLRFPFQNSHLSRLPSICVEDQNPVVAFLLLFTEYRYQKIYACYLCCAWESSEEILEWGEGLSDNSSCGDNWPGKLPSGWSSLSGHSVQMSMNET
jgi:hypothetical protein